MQISLKPSTFLFSTGIPKHSRSQRRFLLAYTIMWISLESSSWINTGIWLGPQTGKIASSTWMSELSFWFAVFKSPFYSIISFFPLFSTLSVPVIFTFHENLTFSHFLPYLAMLQSREFLVTCPCNTISQSWVMTPTAPSCDRLMQGQRNESDTQMNFRDIMI